MEGWGFIGGREKTCKVRDGLGEPCPLTSQVRNVLTQLAREGVALRDPSMSEDAEWHTIRRLPTFDLRLVVSLKEVGS